MPLGRFWAEIVQLSQTLCSLDVFVILFGGCYRRVGYTYVHNANNSQNSIYFIKGLYNELLQNFNNEEIKVDKGRKKRRKQQA